MFDDDCSPVVRWTASQLYNAYASITSCLHRMPIRSGKREQIELLVLDKSGIHIVESMATLPLGRCSWGAIATCSAAARRPVATGLGEIVMCSLEPETGYEEIWTPIGLRTLQSWSVRSQLRNLKGVTEVNTIGGYVRQFHITPDPVKLLAHKATMNDGLNAVARNNANGGAAIWNVMASST